MLALAVVAGIVAVYAVMVLATPARASEPRVKGDPRCFVAATPVREIQTRTIDEALAILRADLVDADPGQAGMLLVRSCR